MRRVFLGLAIGAVTVVGLWSAPAAGQESASPEQIEAEFVARINALRAEHGLPRFAVHANLVSKARAWSVTMAGEGRIWHSHLPDGIVADWHRLGENVGMGGSVGALHDAFVASPSHYENLVDPGFQYIGIGVTVAGDGTIFVSEEFMETPAAAEPAGAPERTSATAPAVAVDPATRSASGAESDEPEQVAPALASHEEPAAGPSVARERGTSESSSATGPAMALAGILGLAVFGLALVMRRMVLR